MASTMDDELVHKLRSDNFDKFKQLVNMHLSLTDIELTADQVEDLWAVQQRGKTQASPSFFGLESSGFGQLIREKLRLGGKSPSQPRSPSTLVDAAQQRQFAALLPLIGFLSMDDVVKTEGIFRKSGSQVRQQTLSSLLSKGDSIDVEGAVTKGEMFPHDVATVLKSTLCAFPQPLFCDAHHPIYVTVAGWASNTEQWSKSAVNMVIRRQLRVVRLLLLMLPCYVVDFLHDLFRLLQRTASCSAFNKMTEDNLAVVFAPSLLFPRCVPEKSLASFSSSLTSLLATMIRRMEDVFTIPEELVRDVKQYYKTQTRLLSPAWTPCMDSSYKTNRVSDEDDAVVTTVMFVDPVRSARDKQAITTETEMAQLYAHVQLMPKGSEKDRRLKQFQEYNRKRLLDSPSDRRMSMKRKNAVVLDKPTCSSARMDHFDAPENYPALKKPRILLNQDNLDVHTMVTRSRELVQNEVLSPTSNEFYMAASGSPLHRTSTYRYCRKQHRLLPPPKFDFDVSCISPYSATASSPCKRDENVPSKYIRFPSRHRRPVRAKDPIVTRF